MSFAAWHRRLRIGVMVGTYRLLLYPLQPREVRRAFGAEVIDELRRSLVEAEAAGSGGGRVWLRAVADVRAARRLARRSPAAAAGRLPRGENGMSMFAHDLRYALRSFRQQPGFMTSVLLMLALSIGAGTLVFSVTNAYLFRALPYPQPERLVRVATFPIEGDFRTYLPILEQLDTVDWPLRDEVIADLAAWDLDGFTILSGEQPVAVPGAWVTAGYFGALGVEPVMGRAFGADDFEGADESVAVISHRLWQSTFGGAPDILGRSFTAYSTDRPDEAESFRIVGVMGDDFWYFNRFTEVLLPIRGPRTPSLVRLRDGVSYEQASAHLTAIAAAQVDTSAVENWQIEVNAAHESHVRQVRPALLVLTGVGLLVLLVACGNLALLLLVRAVGREHEISLRRSLGASQGRIFGQLFAEGLVLAILAGGAGLALAFAALRALRPAIQQQLGATVPGGVEGIHLDGRVLAVAVAASGATGLLFGLVPALAATRGRLGSLLRGAGGGTSDGVRGQGLRNALIIGEVALSLALLIGAGLMTRSAMHLGALDLGFDAERLLKANVSLRAASYPEAEQRLAFVERVFAGARALPEVVSIAVVSPHPFRGGAASGVPVEGDGGAGEGHEAAVQIASRDYLETMRIPLLEGRWFQTIDRDGSEPVVVISDTLAERLWPGASAVGRRVRAAGMMASVQEARWRTVVGVVGGVRKGLTGPQVPDVYVPFSQNASTFFFLMVRTHGEPMQALPGLQRVVWSVDLEQPLGGEEPMSAVVGAAGARPRFLARLLGGFSLFAAGLALFGLYAVVSYAVAQRRREVAVRMAVGAQRAAVVGLFMRRGMTLVAAGMAIGLLVSYGLVGVLESQLFGVEALDPITYGLVLAALAVAALLAVFAPARRAAACDPMATLRRP